LERMVICAADMVSSEVCSEILATGIQTRYIPGLSSAVPVACSARTVVPLATRAWIRDMMVAVRLGFYYGLLLG
jgi:hypothetical protein